MKKIITLVTVIAIVMTAAAPVNAASRSDKQLVKAFCQKHYKGCKVKYIASKNLTAKKLTSRKGKKIVIVEVVKTTSQGWSGLTKEGHYIAYNKKAKKGKAVTSYIIYNPKSNHVDDTAAVVDNQRIRR